MPNSEARRRKERQKEQIKQRYNVVIDPENYEYIPAKKQADYYDNDVNQRVAIYVSQRMMSGKRHPMSCKRSITRSLLHATPTGRL